MSNINQDIDISAKRFSNLILDIGTFLLASGAHCGRLNSNIKRMANSWNFEIDLYPSFKGLLVSVKNLSNPNDSITAFKESPPHSVHLEVLTLVSNMSWKVVEENLSIEEAEAIFEKIKHTPNYNPFVISLAVGVSCASLCLFSLGDIKNAFLALCAAFLGSIVRFKIVKMKFNPMISIILAAFITTIITGFGAIYDIGAYPEAAMATAVLYLIPGVPLLNCAIDLIEGYLSSAVNRALFAGFILLSIAVGMTLSITLMGIENF